MISSPEFQKKLTLLQQEATGKPVTENAILVHEERVYVYRLMRRLWEDLGPRVTDPKPGERAIALGLTDLVFVEGGLEEVLRKVFRCRLNLLDASAVETVALLVNIFVEAGWKSPTALNLMTGEAEIQVHHGERDYSTFQVNEVEAVLAQVAEGLPWVVVETAPPRDVVAHDRQIDCFPKDRIRKISLRQFQPPTLKE